MVANTEARGNAANQRCMPPREPASRTTRGGSMPQARSVLCACAAASLFAFAAAGCSNQTGTSGASADTRAADEAAIRAATSTMDQSVEAKDLDRIVSLYQDDAVLFAPKAP